MGTAFITRRGGTGGVRLKVSDEYASTTQFTNVSISGSGNYWNMTFDNVFGLPASSMSSASFPNVGDYWMMYAFDTASNKITDMIIWKNVQSSSYNSTSYSMVIAEFHSSQYATFPTLSECLNHIEYLYCNGSTIKIHVDYAILKLTASNSTVYLRKLKNGDELTEAFIGERNFSVLLV